MTIRSTKLAMIVATATVASAITGLSLGSPSFASGPSAGTEVPNSALPSAPTPQGRSRADRSSRSRSPPTRRSPPEPGSTSSSAPPPVGWPPRPPRPVTGTRSKATRSSSERAGWVDYTNVLPNHGYTVYALPDANLGESSSGTPVCNLSNECVLYIGQDQNDFTQPHFFSQLFYVQPVAGDTGSPAGNGTIRTPRAHHFHIDPAEPGDGRRHLQPSSEGRRVGQSGRLQHRCLQHHRGLLALEWRGLLYRHRHLRDRRQPGRQLHLCRGDAGPVRPSPSWPAQLLSPSLSPRPRRARRRSEAPTAQQRREVGRAIRSSSASAPPAPPGPARSRVAWSPLPAPAPA